jgi:replicative DNA helicase
LKFNPIDITPHRLIPQNKEAEQYVLGAILIENQSFIKTYGLISENDFYFEPHRKIFSAMVELFEQGQPIDLLTLPEKLRKQGQLDEAGGVGYIASLVEMVPTAANMKYYAQIVKEKSILRNLISASTDIITDCYEDSDDIDELLDKAEKRIFEISERRILPGFVPIHQVLKESFDTLETLFQRQELVTGVATGFREFDSRTAGLQPSDLIIVAGRPSMGKTAFCLNIAQYVATVGQKPVAIFSLEMSRQQLVIRLLCSEARVNSTKVRTGFLDKEEWPRLTRAAGIISEAPIYIDDTPALSILDIRARARRLKAEQGLNLVIIDYLQLIKGRGRQENRQQEISEITRSLKSLAKELNAPVIAISQLSRAVEQRSDRRPQLSDLRESGSIEQDGDLIVFLYRDEVYNENSPDKGTAELIIGKQRNGPIGSVKLTFIKEYTRFENYSPGI